MGFPPIPSSLPGLRRKRQRRRKAAACLLCCFLLVVQLPAEVEPFSSRAIVVSRCIIRRATTTTLGSSVRPEKVEAPCASCPLVIIGETPVSSERQNEVDIPPPLSRLYSVSSLTSVSTIVLLLTIPMAANAIDLLPVKLGILGIPINPDYRYFVAGGICAAASHGITTPLDGIKTRIQSDPTAFAGLSLGAAAAQIVQRDGAAILFRGLGSTVAGYSLEGAVKFGLYESLKPVLVLLLSNNKAAGYLAASVAAGACASLLLCPFEQSRIRLVTDPSFANGLAPALSRMVKEEGLATVLFGGFPAMLSKQVPYTFCKQVSFDVFATALYTAAYNANLAPIDVKMEVSILAAFLASILASMASQPGDVILTATYKKRGDDDGIPQFMDVVSDIYQSQGVSGFFTGIFARFLHVGSIITSQLVLYDYIKVLLGLPATGT